MVRYDPYTDSFIDNSTKEVTSTNNLDALSKPIIQMKVVEVSDESIEKIADAVVRKLADRKTENSSEKPNNCEPQTDCNGCKFVGWYDTDFPCVNCSRKTKDYYSPEQTKERSE